MCESNFQIQYQCTISWSQGYIEQTLPPEWAYFSCALEVEETVRKRWSVVKGDDNLRVTNFRILSTRVTDDLTVLA